MHVARRTLLFSVAFIFLTVPLVVSAQSPLQFVSVPGCRVADTRLSGNPIQGGTSQNFPIQGSQGSCSNIPASATAYSLNVTVIPHGPLGYLTIWPTGENQPVVSTLNSYDGRVKANAAIVGAGSGGEVSVFATNTTDVALDIDGYFMPASGSTFAFYPVTPCRVLDSRQGHFLPANKESDYPVSGLCNIPSSAQAYSLNLTAIPYGPLGYMTVWPTGQTQPVVSTLNSPTGTVVANAAMVEAGANGEVAIFPTNNTDLIIDINGYYEPANLAPGGMSLYTLTPCRILDTRLANGEFAGTLPVDAVQSPCSIPSIANALVLNATVIPEVNLGYLTLWPNGQPQPLASTLNSYDGAVTSNMAVTPTSNGFVNAFASNQTELLLDVTSYFGVPSGLSGSYAFSVRGYNTALNRDAAESASGRPGPPVCQSGGPVMITGSFVADGIGHVSGVFDMNCGGGIPATNVSFQGKYSVQANGLGTLTIIPTLNYPIDFSIAISSTGDGRLVLENETNCDGAGGCYLPTTWATGAIRVQYPAAFTLQQVAGNFASGFSGVDPTLNRYAGAGAYQIAQTGSLMGSFVDTNDNGVLENNVPTGGSLLTLDPATGRGRAAYVTKGLQTNWVYYVISANELILQSTDPINNPANLVQQTMLRQGSALGQSSLNGVGVVRTSGIASGAPDTVLGLLTTNGSGGGTLSVDENKGGTLTQQQMSQGTYNVASNGRVTLTGFGNNTPPILYLVNQNQAFIVGQDNEVASGYMAPQSGEPFSTASAIGTYWGGSLLPITSAVTDSVTTVFADGNGNLTGTSNTSGSGGTASQPVNGTYSVDATGRITLNENGSLAAILYVVSPTRVVMLPATDPNPALSVLGSTN